MHTFERHMCIELIKKTPRDQVGDIIDCEFINSEQSFKFSRLPVVFADLPRLPVKAHLPGWQKGVTVYRRSSHKSGSVNG